MKRSDRPSVRNPGAATAKPIATDESGYLRAQDVADAGPDYSQPRETGGRVKRSDRPSVRNPGVATAKPIATDESGYLRAQDVAPGNEYAVPDDLDSSGSDTGPDYSQPREVNVGTRKNRVQTEYANTIGVQPGVEGVYVDARGNTTGRAKTEYSDATSTHRLATDGHGYVRAQDLGANWAADTGGTYTFANVPNIAHVETDAEGYLRARNGYTDARSMRRADFEPVYNDAASEEPKGSKR